MNAITLFEFNLFIENLKNFFVLSVCILSTPAMIIEEALEEEARMLDDAGI
jgi:hypothetical protein